VGFDVIFEALALLAVPDQRVAVVLEPARVNLQLALDFGDVLRQVGDLLLEHGRAAV
jgi:hypothetical protein